MKIFIKKLNCQGTYRNVLEEVKKTGLKYSSYEYGEIEFALSPSTDQWREIEKNLLKSGVQIRLQENPFVTLIRQAVNEVVRKRTIPGKDLPQYLSEKFRIKYDYMDKFFHEETGYFIDEFFIENSIYNRKKRRSTV